MKYVLVLIFLVLISGASALQCDKYVINKNVKVGENPLSEIINCQNIKNESVSIFQSGGVFTVNQAVPFTVEPYSNLSFSISFSKFDNEGLYSDFLYSSDGLNIKVKVNVTKAEENNIIVFPTAKVINIQQNQEKTQSLQIIVPSNYPRNIVIQSVTQNPEISLLNFGDLSLGQVSPGMTLNIPFTVNSKDAQTGTYTTDINILATDSLGQIKLPNSNIQIVVSANINPITNSSFSRPACSIPTQTLNLNGTYTLTCTGAVTNLDISPQYNEFIQGVKAELNSGVYTYTFQPIKIGISKLITEFKILNSPIFSPDIQNIKIVPTTLNVNGNINLDVEFFQENLKKEKNNLKIGDTRFLVIDASSKNIITDYDVYINGQSYPNDTFNLESNKVYDFRVSSNGYNDLVLSNLTANQLFIDFSIVPYKESYEQGDVITINSSVNNLTILVNDFTPTNPITLSSSGNVTIKVIKEGYISSNKTILVNSIPSVVSCSPQSIDWKKNEHVICSLSKVSNWSVTLSNKDGQKNLAQGNSNQIDFKIPDNGDLKIVANNRQIFQQTISSNGVISIIIDYWYIVLGIFFVIVILIFLFKRNNDGGNVNFS